MNKKLLMFGIMGVFALALVSAALVGYLSNTVESEVSVDSPLELVILSVTNGEIVNGKVVADIYGAETVTIESGLNNLANATIVDVTTELRIEGADSLAEIDSIVYADLMGTFDLLNLGHACEKWEGGEKILYAYINPAGFNMPPLYNGVDDNPSTLEITFNQFALGSYSGEAKVVGTQHIKCI